jgi:exodeoxyribonuclease V beta subunit
MDTGAVDTGAAAAAPPAAQPGWGLPDGAAGQRFGTFAHEVLEHVDFTSPDLERDLRLLVSDKAREGGLDLDEDQVVSGLAAAVRAPLGSLFEAARSPTSPRRIASRSSPSTCRSRTVSAPT